MNKFSITNYKNFTLNTVQPVTSKDLQRDKIQSDIDDFERMGGGNQGYSVRQVWLHS